MSFGSFLVFRDMIIDRKATTLDISLIQDLARKSWEVAYADILSQEQLDYMLDLMYSERTLASHFENPNYHYYIIQENEQALGFVGYENHAEEKTTKLHRIYLIPESKGKGAGKFGLNLVKDQAVSAGDSRIILTVNKYNSAKDFYEHQGYTIYEEAVFDIGEGYVMDDYLMEIKF